MASTVLRLSILVLCVGFILTMPLEENKYRSHRRSKRFLQIFDTVSRKMIEKHKNSSTPVEEQAENVLIAQGEIRETVEDLVEQGQELESFALSLEDIEEAEKDMNAAQVGFWKKLGDALNHLAKQTFKFANLVLKTSKEISEALLDGIKNVEEIFKISLDDIREAAEDVSLGIRKAEFAVDHVGSFLANPNRENCMGMLAMVVELTRKATENLNEVEQLSSDLEETAEEDGENIARLLAEAAGHLGRAVALTAEK